MAGRGFVPRTLALLAAISLLAAHFPARADSNSRTASVPEGPSAVHVVIVGQAPASLEERISSWFPASSMVTTVTRQESLDPAEVLHPATIWPVGVWVVIREPGARLFFSVDMADGTKPRYLTNDLELEHGLDEVGMEQLAQVVYFSSLALWRGELESARNDVERALELGPPSEQSAAVQDGTRREEPGAAAAPKAVPANVPADVPAPGPYPRRTARSAWRLHTGLEYAARARGAEGLGQGPGALFAFLRSNRQARSGGRLHLDLLLPTRPSRREVELDVRGYSLSVGVFLSSPVGPFFFDVELATGLDLIHYSTYSVDNPALRRESSGLDVRPIACAGLGLEATVERFRIGLSSRVTAQVLRTQYELEDPAGRSQLLEPWIIQPGLALEFSY